MSIVNGQANPAGKNDLVSTVALDKALVIQNVKVIEVTKRIEIPQLVFIDTPQVRYVTHEEPTEKFTTVLKETVRFVPKEVETVKYATRVEETIKFVPKEVEVDVPKWVSKDVEIPVKKEVPLEILTIQNLEQVQQLIKDLPTIIENLNSAVVAITAFTEDIKLAQKEIAALRGTKLVEEIIKVPKLEYHTIEVERIVWKDVPRERIV